MINYRKRNEINEMRWNALVEQHPTGLPRSVCAKR